MQRFENKKMFFQNNICMFYSKSKVFKTSCTQAIHLSLFILAVYMNRTFIIMKLNPILRNLTQMHLIYLNDCGF